MTNAETLPPLHAQWLKELLKISPPPETKATCATCRLCESPATKGKEKIYFSPLSKCCTYTPYLPNFLVGRVLLEADEKAVPGRTRVQQRIAQKIAVTPLGLGRTQEYLQNYSQAVDSGEFGQHAELVCPYYLAEQGGLCGIWQHRNAVCATWFCKHERGKPGMLFWQRVQELFTLLEKNLAIWCERQVGLDQTALETAQRLHSPIYESHLPEKAYRAVWGSWYGRESEFFEQCAQASNTLSWPELLKLGDSEVGTKIDEVRQAWRRLNSSYRPEFLEQGKYKLVSQEPRGEKVLLETYRKYDLLELPTELFEKLAAFDGTQSAASLLPNLPDELWQALLDHEVLVPPGLDDLLS